MWAFLCLPCCNGALVCYYHYIETTTQRSKRHVHSSQQANRRIFRRLWIKQGSIIYSRQVKGMVVRSHRCQATSKLPIRWRDQRTAKACEPVSRQGFPSWEPTKKPRINWKKEIKAERNKVIDEALKALQDKRRDVPEAWHRGYNSAITTLELMKR